MLRRTQLALAATVGAGAIAAGVGLSAEASPDPSGTATPATPGPATPDGTTASPTGTGTVGPPVAISITAEIKDAKGTIVGSLTAKEDQDGKPQISITVSGLPTGYHGLHIHTKGVCDPGSVDPGTGSPFSSAGEHFSLGSEPHPGHSGDLPDLLVGGNGTGSASFITDRFQLKQLADADGSAVVIHEKADNQANIPDRYNHPADTDDPESETTMTAGPDMETLKGGDSGARIACGVIIMK
ncbi:superoxide dismutase family protein [Planobispora longispora]|uniref:Superoxide dismutase [Cu-Zn] n=1 Tax=Planobispora longispora TaxID=28887 RepID=A0A8J3RLA6_9ACTN|nr:superoxide dismutase family protein [Planobispora longispora]BFE82913.1 hypothetical protein GCM10020093_055140 [Planobispora longispora]GIH78626.1 hypothetical protein Plo01_50550 [Planobispora longispora]